MCLSQNNHLLKFLNLKVFIQNMVSQNHFALFFENKKRSPPSLQTPEYLINLKLPVKHPLDLFLLFITNPRISSISQLFPLHQLAPPYCLKLKKITLPPLPELTKIAPFGNPDLKVRCIIQTQCIMYFEITFNRKAGPDPLKFFSYLNLVLIILLTDFFKS